MNDTVYVVWWNVIDDSHIVKIYSTKKRALGYIKRQAIQYHKYLTIQEWDVN